MNTRIYLYRTYQQIKFSIVVLLHLQMSTIVSKEVRHYISSSSMERFGLCAPESFVQCCTLLLLHLAKGSCCSADPVVPHFLREAVRIVPLLHFKMSALIGNDVSQQVAAYLVARVFRSQRTVLHCALSALGKQKLSVYRLTCAVLSKCEEHISSCSYFIVECLFPLSHNRWPRIE